MDITDGLLMRGQSVYDALIKDRPVNAAHKAMALNAARMADTLDRLELAFAAEPHLTVVNGQGTETINPIIAEARQYTSSLMQILAKFGMAELPEAISREKSVFDQLAERRADRLRSANGGSDTANSM